MIAVLHRVETGQIKNHDNPNCGEKKSMAECSRFWTL